MHCGDAVPGARGHGAVIVFPAPAKDRSSAAVAVTCGAATLAVLVRLATGDTGIDTLALPIGLPWLHANLRLDALSAYFLLLVNLLAAVVAVFALGYGGHEKEPGRVLPAFPLFIAGMNLVLLADDAFSFLLGLGVHVAHLLAAGLANHREPGTRRAGACLSGHGHHRQLALLLAFGVLAEVSRRLQLRWHPHAGAATPRRAAALAAGVAGDRIEGRSRSAACLAAARPSRRSQPCLRLDERGR